MNKKEFDIIIIGAGSAGLNVAGFMNQAGFKTLLIDRSDYNIGGDCLNFGCVPSKALIHLARKVKAAGELENFNLVFKNKIDIKKVTQYIDKKQAVIKKHENARNLRKKGINVVLGKAEFVCKKTVRVGKEIYQGKKIVIATGSRPRVPGIPGLKKVDYYTNETVFDIKYLPRKFLVVGGGPIGIELGQAFSDLGCQVTVIQAQNRILPKEDTDLSDILLKELKRRGIKFFLNYRLSSFRNKNTALIKNKKNGSVLKVNFDAVLLAVGRSIDLGGLNLEKAAVETNEKGFLKINDKLTTTNKSIFVCGDAAGSLQFTHAAELHAKIVINNFFSPFSKKLDYKNFSRVIYTTPEVAAFGKSKARLKKEKVNFKVLTNDFKQDDRAIIEDYPSSYLKLFVAKNKILGGAMIAPNAGELVQELILANSSGVKISEIFDKIYPYPTATRVNKSTVTALFSQKLKKTWLRKLLRLLY
ncbi:MAG: NAD(P)/FAD-dependent oxidoreductase [Candidatus Moranbacteria bacterium]|nr:NAD(P)/FAD-dependent oxidoreductase [Candidatus Moranbacteria bacterium]